MTKIKTPKIEELFDAGVHIGHQARRWHPKMEKYIYSTENKIHVFDLEQTEELLKNAATALYEAAKKGGQIIFVGTKRQASVPVKEAAKQSGALYVTERWLGGTLTNFRMLKRNMDKLVNLIKRRDEGSLQKYTKKERLLIDREIEKLERTVGGIVNLKGTPAMLVLIDPRKEKTAVKEALNNKVPLVALIDTNSDPSNINYPIPGNDDAIKSISLIINTLAHAVEEGYKEYAKLGDKAKETKTNEIPVVEDVAPKLIVRTDDPVVLEEIAQETAKDPLDPKAVEELKKAL